MPRVIGWSGRLWTGVILIALGVLFLLDKLGYIAFEYFFSTWWPSLIILLALISLVNSGGRRWRSAVFWIVVGLMLQIGHLDLFPWWTPELFWPFLLIFFGMWLLFNRLRPWGGRSGAQEAGAAPGSPSAAPGRTEETVDAFAFWSGLERLSTSKSFRGGQATAIMGGIKLDLSNAELCPGEQQLQLEATMGGIELRVPQHWHVQLEGSPIMGAVVDKRANPAGATGGTSGVLRVRAFAFWGAVEIQD
jgi:predicted membrane protein